METNLVNAYKSLAAVVADPGFAGLPGPSQDIVKNMMTQIRQGLIAIAQAKAAAQVDALLK